MTLIDRMKKAPMSAIDIYEFDKPKGCKVTPWRYGTSVINRLSNSGVPVYEIGIGLFRILENKPPRSVKLKDVRWPGQPLCRIPDTNGIGGSWML